MDCRVKPGNDEGKKALGGEAMNHARDGEHAEMRPSRHIFTKRNNFVRLGHVASR